MTIEMTQYNDLGVYPELVYLPVWQLYQTLEELSKIVSERKHFKDAALFNKYAKDL